MYESGNEIIDTTVKTENIQGGRLGKVSNEMVFISVLGRKVSSSKWLITNHLTP